ncbi:MAG: VCBS repeat-containing protein, partial [Deltaproteobacteria bacterium]|nr:VCBS repeat-containing protein [Nannocystaceae bacterium]
MIVVLGCGESATDPFAGGGAGSQGTEGQPGDTSGVADTTGSSGAIDDSGGPPKLDIAIPDFDTSNPMPSCTVQDGMDAFGDCEAEAPPDSFDPEVQWSWNGGSVIVTPLVANLTDDDASGGIDLCDTPDVIVVAGNALAAEIVVLDGATGAEHLTFATAVSGQVTPAIGDIDGDGLPEVVAAVGPPLGSLSVIAFEHDGTVKWQSAAVWPQDQGGALGIADFDNDGAPEIYADGFILDANGGLVTMVPAQTGWQLAGRSSVTVAADLDDDDDLELVLGQAAYHHDGTEIWNDETVQPGYPSIANLDGDDDPEILINNPGGITILEHDGTVKYKDERPVAGAGPGAWFRPATVHDFDGDDVSEFAVSSASRYSVIGHDLVPHWSADVQDGSGWASGTAFDFLGDGLAEAMYADEVQLFVFSDVGMPLLQVPRSS